MKDFELDEHKEMLAIGERLVQIRKCLRVLRGFQSMRYEEFIEWLQRQVAED
ncbi:MAG: hypothetical protein Kow0063_03250 [Anaerolineae bacterium]